jgi:hypothetical protein
MSFEVRKRLNEVNGVVARYGLHMFTYPQCFMMCLVVIGLIHCEDKL